jgi:hypothetical protein
MRSTHFILSRTIQWPEVAPSNIGYVCDYSNTPTADDAEVSPSMRTM